MTGATESPKTGKVVVFDGPGLPLRIEVEPVMPPGRGQTLVRMTMAGVCGSDVHRIAGHLPAPARPVCFGHEAVGVIIDLGEGMTTDRAGTPLAVGDRVYWAPAAPCGACQACRAGNQMLCRDVNWPAEAGSPNGAAYREIATVHPRSSLYRISDGTPSESVIAFGCAMPTAITGIERLGGLGRHVVIQGCGPVGLASTLLAGLSGADTITVIGDPASRLDVAARLGATATLPLTSTSRDERRARVLEITGGEGATAVIEAAGSAEAFPEGIGLLGMNGRYLVLGLYSGAEKIPFDPVPINNLNLHIVGSLGYAQDALLQAIRIATEHGEEFGFGELVGERFPLEQTQDAIASAARGEAVKTLVLPASPQRGR